MYNKALLIGRLGQNPELKNSQNNVSYVTFSLATNEYWRDKNGNKQERTEWHRIVAFGRIAEICDQYLSKGRMVFVDGRIQTRSWEDKNGIKRFTTEILLLDLKMLDSKSENFNNTSKSLANDTGELTN